MLACARGIAIVEDKFNPKLNSNVAMEWGWMRAMRKPVLYLVENTVAVVPADVAGLIQSRFDWKNPQGDIPALVAKELT
jgi:predicted nucleotide-binding protein